MSKKIVWQYETLSDDQDNPDFHTNAELNQLGSLGWELAVYVPETSREYGMFVFKRPTQ